MLTTVAIWIAIIHKSALEALFPLFIHLVSWLIHSIIVENSMSDDGDQLSFVGAFGAERFPPSHGFYNNIHVMFPKIMPLCSDSREDSLPRILKRWILHIDPRLRYTAFRGQFERVVHSRKHCRYLPGRQEISRGSTIQLLRKFLRSLFLFRCALAVIN